MESYDFCLKKKKKKLLRNEYKEILLNISVTLDAFPFCVSNVSNQT